MQTGVKQVFYFNASATSIGGYLENPKDAKNPLPAVPTPSSVSLSPTGGEVVSDVKPSWLNRMRASSNDLTYTRAYTYAVGKPSKMNGPWSHRVVSVVENLNLYGTIKVKKLVAQMLIEHPGWASRLDSATPERKISFSGTQITGVQVGKNTLDLAINPNFFPENEARVDPYDRKASTQPTIGWSALSGIAVKQGEALMQASGVPQWAKDRYSWVTDPQQSIHRSPSGYTLCSLVDSISGLTPGAGADSHPTPGHFFEVENFGRVFLGEALVHPHGLNLSLIRVELGCDRSGQVSGGNVITNGETCPPN